MLRDTASETHDFRGLALICGAQGYTKGYSHTWFAEYGTQTLYIERQEIVHLEIAVARFLRTIIETSLPLGFFFE